MKHINFIFLWVFFFYFGKLLVCSSVWSFIWRYTKIKCIKTLIQKSNKSQLFSRYQCKWSFNCKVLCKKTKNKKSKKAQNTAHPCKTYPLCFFCFVLFRNGILDELTKSCKDVADFGLHFATNPDFPDTLHTDNSLKQVNKRSNSPTSCNVTIGDSTSACSDVRVLQQLPTCFNSCAVFNNYLFHQDPRTGHISLLPVQLRAPQSLLGLDINLSMVQQHFQRVVIVPDNPYDPHTNGLNVPVRPRAQDYPAPFSIISGSSIVLESHMELDAPRRCAVQTGKQPPPEVASPEVHPALKEVIDLLKGEFLLQTRRERECEDIAMGM